MRCPGRPVTTMLTSSHRHTGSACSNGKVSVTNRKPPRFCGPKRTPTSLIRDVFLASNKTLRRSLRPLRRSLRDKIFIHRPGEQTMPLDSEQELVPTADNFIDLSLFYFQARRYRECIAAARYALKLKPDFATAF